MAKTIFIGVGGAARKVKKGYVGVSGVARKVKKAFVGVGGVARLCYSSAPDDPTYTGSYALANIGNYRYMYLKTSGTLTINGDGVYDAFAVGAGGAGGTSGAYSGTSKISGGGGGGYTQTKHALPISAGTIISVTIGTGSVDSAGGISQLSGSGILVSALGGNSPINDYRGAKGGSGGGAARNVDDDQRPIGVETVGGSNGGNGTDGVSAGGLGQATTTRAFGEETNTLFSGGGGGGCTYAYGPTAAGGAGGGGSSGNRNTAAIAGMINTGGGGGSQAYNSGSGAAGGSGIVIVRWSIE